ncbi:hypothetical protein R3P38DRAFT_2787545 [Favolaschia claudopus]|uniref:Uncharacterized protein n=1 Tax=Favolaschia claudopus TaxID=2862362 RepID=A0AAW0AP46_9AGAR
MNCHTKSGSFSHVPGDVVTSSIFFLGLLTLHVVGVELHNGFVDDFAIGQWHAHSRQVFPADSLTAAGSLPSYLSSESFCRLYLRYLRGTQAFSTDSDTLRHRVLFEVLDCTVTFVHDCDTRGGQAGWADGSVWVGSRARTRRLDLVILFRIRFVYSVI